MTKLDTSIFRYDDHEVADSDWEALEAAVQRGELEIADAAFVTNENGHAIIVERKSIHGWGKGAIVGAVVGILFPPSLLGAAAVGAGSGALIAGLKRALGRDHVQRLGETLDSGAIAIIVVNPVGSTNAVTKTLKQAGVISIAPGATAEAFIEALEQG
jgi:uncharacterized membrane protein